MCSFSSEIFYLIPKLEDCLSGGSFNSLCAGGFKFTCAGKSHKVSDYICYASNHQCALPTIDVFKMKLIEILPWIKDFIVINVAPHGFAMSLSRSECFLRGLKDVDLLGPNYGFNSIFINEVFTFSILETKQQHNSLISLRLKLVKELLQNIVLACGGALDLHHANREKVIKINITNKNYSGIGDIDLVVGPVITDCSNASLQMYESLRMEDITALCENKLDDNNIFEEKNKILNATTVFDLLQCSFQRPVKLHLHEKESDKRTSCKGSVFVLYNYARLYSLCSRFDDEVSVGLYPKLPELSDIDFMILSSDDEWRIMFESILHWPSVINKSIADIKSGRPKIHLILEFLKKIATNFSQFYHRTRVLTEPRSHLLPVLFARVHLLKSLLQIYHNAFRLIGISPLQKM